MADVGLNDTANNRPPGGAAGGGEGLSIDDLLGSPSGGSPAGGSSASPIRHDRFIPGANAAAASPSSPRSQNAASATATAPSAAPAAVNSKPASPSSASAAGAGAGGGKAMNPFDRPAAKPSSVGGNLTPSASANFSSGQQQPSGTHSTGVGAGGAGVASSPGGTQAWVNAATAPPLPPDPIEQVKELHENLRHQCIALFCIAFVSWILSFVQVASNAYTYERGAGTFSLTLWTAKFCIQQTTGTQCGDSTVPFSHWCGALDSRWRAMQALAILIVLYASFMLVVGYAAMDVERARPLFWDLTSKYVYPVKLILFSSLGFWLFLLIQWALVAGSYHVAPCSDSVAVAQRNRLLGVRSLNESGFKLSASWAVTFVMWCYWTFIICWTAYRMRRSGQSSADLPGAEDPSAHGVLSAPPKPVPGRQSVSSPQL